MRDERSGRPPEAADSLTPWSDWARPIDPDAADRQRHAMAEATDSGAPPYPRWTRRGSTTTPNTVSPVRRVRTRRLVGPAQATPHSESLARALRRPRSAA